jgi:starch phosphorylase
MRRHCIGMNGSFFNTHRMLGQYVSNAYFPLSASVAASDQVVVNDEEPVAAVA